MSKEIMISKKATRYLKSLPKNVRERIEDKIDLLATRPQDLANNIIQLQEKNNLFRLRVGNYRVIYTDKGEILFITKIGARGDIY